MEKKDLSKKCEALKEQLSLIGQKHLEKVLIQVKDQPCTETYRKELRILLLTQLQMRIAVLEETKNLFSEEVEKMGQVQTNYESRLEFFSAIHTEIEDGYTHLFFHLENHQYPEEEINAAVDTIKCLIHCTLAEFQDKTDYEPDRLRFNFINRLKLLLYSKGEGINEIIKTLKQDEHQIKAHFE